MNEKTIDRDWDPSKFDDSWDPDTAPDTTIGEFGKQFANAPLRKGDPLHGEIVRRPFQDSVQESSRPSPPPMSSPGRTKRKSKDST